MGLKFVNIEFSPGSRIFFLHILYLGYMSEFFFFIVLGYDDFAYFACQFFPGNLNNSYFFVIDTQINLDCSGRRKRYFLALIIEA